MGESDNTTKRQHYVWRGYLKRWTKTEKSSDRIYTFRKCPMGNQQEYQYAMLEEVGFGKYYYDMTGFSESDVKIISYFILHMQKDRKIKFDIKTDMEAANKKRDYIEELMCRYESIDNTNHFIEKIINGDLSFYSDSVVQNTIDLMKRELINTLLGGERIYSDDELCGITLNAMRHLEDEDSKYDFLRFIFMQQQRSPRVHDNQVKFFEECKKLFPQIQKVNTSFYVNTMMIYFAEQIALNISKNFHTWLERYENMTDIPFITCDCPVVNLTGDEIGEKHEFYFPLSPRVAIKLCTAYKESLNGNVMNSSVDISDKTVVDQLNQIVAQEAYKEVFANDDAVLHDVCERIKSK